MFGSVFNNILSFLFMLIIVLTVTIWWGVQEFYTANDTASEGTFIINPGDSFNTIVTNLYKQKFIDNTYIFKLGVIFKQSQKKLRYGEYEFSERASMNSILKSIVNGQTKIHKLVIPEGFSNHQIVERLKSEGLLSGSMQTLLEEGSYAPQTYLFSRGDKRNNLLNLMVERQSAILEKAWQNRKINLPLKNKYEALILASIIEEEASLPEEQRVISSVFINRLKSDMRLQTDPTVIFGITKGKYVLGRGLLKRELNHYTPWNTYRIKGLPPTPITNPGEAAINAATQPANTDFLYFVANGKGGHWFAKTNEEHNENVRKWREIEKKRNNKLND